MGMNAHTTPGCVQCGLQRCGNCHMECHKVKIVDPDPPQSTEASGQKILPKRETTSHTTPIDVGKSTPKPTWVTNPVPFDHEWDWYSINAAIASDQLGLLQDLSLTESKAPKMLDADFEMSDGKQKQIMRKEQPGMLESARQEGDNHASSGDPTPASEAWEYWEECPELNSSSIDSEALTQALKGPLDMIFQEWLEAIPCDDDSGDKSSLPSASTARSSNHQQPKSKRKRVNNTDTEDSDSRPSKLCITEKRSRKVMPLHKLLACPYFKKQSRRHRACCGFGFTKISYVKAHIYRKHAISIYCPVCQRPFDNVQLRDDHSRERSCEPAENFNAPDGITSEQRDWLHQRGPRDLTEEKQWFRIFGFLFPGHPLPHSAYNDTAFSEDLLDFRDFISEPSAQDILLQRVRENPTWTPEMEVIFRPDLVHGLDQLYWRWAATAHRETGQMRTIEIPSQETGTSSNQSMNEEMSHSAPQSEARVGQGGDPSQSVTAAQEASEGENSVTVYETEQAEEPRLESSQVLADGEFELEERKIDEGDQLPPRQLNQDGIGLVLDQHQRVPEELFGLEITDLDTLNFPNDAASGLPVADFTLAHLLDDIGGTEEWASNFDLSNYDALFPLVGPAASPAGGSPVDLGVEWPGEAPLGTDGMQIEWGEMDDFVVIPKPSS